MKTDRLIGILMILLQKETVTAPKLAEKFEVSRRTISRDLETLCKAGIPIVTKQGVHGGISIMENCKVDRTLLSDAELQDVLAGLRSLDSIHKTNHYRQLMEKLSAGSSDFVAGSQTVLIDLSMWDKSAVSDKIALLRAAIEESRKVIFDYHSPKADGQRVAEPCCLLFRWSSWYLWGFCEKRQDFRLFKLNRMTNLRLSDENFQKRAVPLPDLSPERIFPNNIRVKVLFDASCKWRLIEEFGEDSFEQQQDGTLLFQTDHMDRENLLPWLMTFGDKAKLQQPKELRSEIRDMLHRMQEIYEGDAE